MQGMQEAPLEEEMATHSSIPAWENPWTEEPGGFPRVGHVQETEHTCTHVFNFSEADFMEGCQQRGLDCLYPYWKQEKVRKNYFLSSYV